MLCRFLLSLLIAVLFILVACKKETIHVLDFDSITATDSLCQIIGDTALANWTKDEDWITAENNLLAFKTIVENADTALSKLTVLPACPNPTNGQFSITIKSTKKCKLKWVMVNKKLETLAYQQQIIDSGQHLIPFDFLSSTAFDSATNYRLYYGFYNSKDSLYYKGHGNISWQ